MKIILPNYPQLTQVLTLTLPNLEGGWGLLECLPIFCQPDNCLSFIKICVFSNVTIKKTAAVAH